jgi:hypothetical protein
MCCVCVCVCVCVCACVRARARARVCIYVYIFKIEVIFSVTFHTSVLLNIIQIQLFTLGTSACLSLSYYVTTNNILSYLCTFSTVRARADRTYVEVPRRELTLNVPASHCNRTGENFVPVANALFFVLTCRV